MVLFLAMFALMDKEGYDCGNKTEIYTSNCYFTQPKTQISFVFFNIDLIVVGRLWSFSPSCQVARPEGLAVKTVTIDGFVSLIFGLFFKIDFLIISANECPTRCVPVCQNNMWLVNFVRIIQPIFCTYSGSQLMSSLWHRKKLITIAG
jgi:hypothetical protein